MMALCQLNARSLSVLMQDQPCLALLRWPAAFQMLQGAVGNSVRSGLLRSHCMHCHRPHTPMRSRLTLQSSAKDISLIPEGCWQAEQSAAEVQQQLAASRAQEEGLQQQLQHSQGQVAEQLLAAQQEAEDLRQHARQLEATCAGLKVRGLCLQLPDLRAVWVHQAVSTMRQAGA